MFRKILVPLDGSPFGERALPMASTVAKAMGAGVVLVRAVSGKIGPGEDSVAAEHKFIADAEAYLAGVAASLAADGIAVETGTPYGAASEEILVEVNVRQADLIVMCTHGRGGLGRFFYGSVAESILAKSPVPVIMVHPTGPLARLTLEQGKSNIVVPLDGSAYGEASLPHAVELAKTLGGSITLLRVVPPSLGYYPDPVLGQPYVSETGERILESEEAEAGSYLTGVAERLRGEGVTVQWFVRVAWPAEAILDEAKATGAELIVMATHGHTGLRDLLLGNVALDVVRRGTLPMLLVRPADLRPAA